jgi:hypothetical protein
VELTQVRVGGASKGVVGVSVSEQRAGRAIIRRDQSCESAILDLGAVPFLYAISHYLYPLYLSYSDY